MIFDSHAHYDDPAFDEDRESLLSVLKNSGIEKVVNVGASLASTKRAIELASQYDFIYAAAGVHPSDTGELNDENFEWLTNQCLQEKVLAVGEIGLDYYWPEPDREIQKKWFIKQLELAKKVKLPVIIHSRDACEDTLKIMREYADHSQGGVIHCFSYEKEIAEQYVKMGYYIGIGGVVTFKNGRKTKEVVSEIPLDKIVLETDCPYLSPEPNRGKRNDSRNLSYVITQIANLKGISEQMVQEVTFENACKLYRLK